MKNKLALLALSIRKINRQQIHLLFVMVTLAMLVLGAGAPVDGPGTGK